jgi:polysaccharide deacetylase 2 family uncharacterized protein YibQ
MPRQGREPRPEETLPTIEPPVTRPKGRFVSPASRSRRRSRRRTRRLWKAGLVVGCAVLLLLSMLEPQPRRERSGGAPPTPRELAMALPMPPPAPVPPPPVATAPASIAADAPLAPAPPPEPPPVTVEPRSRLAGEPPFRERAPASAAGVQRPVPVPPIEFVRPVPVAFPAPIARRPRGPVPALTVIIDDLGVNGPVTRRTIRLPGPLTLAFLPYGEGTPELAREARAAGHEVFLHLAMEPLGGEDPGPMALLADLGADELRRRLHWALGRVPGAAGVNNHMGSRLTADPRAMAIVMGELARLGLPFLDSMTTAASVAGKIALASGVPATARDLFLDNDPAPAAILAQLERAERLARRTGSAVAIGHPYPSTLQVLADWLPGASARGIRLVPASVTIELRGCAGEPAGHDGCLLRAARELAAGELLVACGEPGCRPAPR